MIEKSLKDYREHFGENYPLMIVGHKTDKEIVERIKYCIEHDEKEVEPEYKDGFDY